MRYHSHMSEEQKPPRPPFGERRTGERSQPFGSHPIHRRMADFQHLSPLPSGADDADIPPAEGEEPPPAQKTDDSFPPDPLPDPAAAASAPPAATTAQPTIHLGVLVRSVGAILLIAAVVATLFTWWTPDAFLPIESAEQLSLALATQSAIGIAAAATPSPVPASTSTPVPPPPQRIGIVSGHRGLHPSTGLPDPGAVCADGLTEASVNESVARLVVDWLTQSGYQVDLLDEFDPRLEGYRALAVVSIHADSCEYINDQATGFKVASFSESLSAEEDMRLVACLIDRYAMTTGLAFHPSVTFDMTQYHNFRELAPETPGAIIEIGFLYLDRPLLTEHPEVVALGIARGILCYLRNEPVGDVWLTLTPAEAVTPAP